jgi:hypothetical protein
LLVKHGLVDSVLQNLIQSLDEFDGMVEQGSQGRAAHVGASSELENVATELVQVVNVMDGLNRFRYRKDGELLSSWAGLSNVLATPQSSADKAGRRGNLDGR